MIGTGAASAIFVLLCWADNAVCQTQGDQQSVAMAQIKQFGEGCHSLECHYCISLRI